MGSPLFGRTTRRVVLTESGLAFWPLAQEALRAAEACMRVGRGEVGPAPMDLVVGTRHELGMSWIVPMLPSLRQAHPQVTFHLYFGSGADLVLRVRLQEVHCAVGSMRTTDPRIDSVRLHPEHYLLVGSPKLLKVRPLRTFAQASTHTLIDTNAEVPLFQYWRESPQGGDRLRFGRIIQMGTIAAVRHQVLQGQGVAVLPEYLVKQDLAAKRLTKLFPSIAPRSDYFRLFFRSDDPRRSLYEAVARTMVGHPLR